MDQAQYQEQDATGLAALVASGEVTAAELLSLAIERAGAVNPRINAVVVPMHEIAAKRAASALEGPYAGVPFLIKDLGQEYAGVVCTGGSRSRANDVQTEHALVVQRWLDAGLVVFGRTNSPEFGSKGITEPLHWGPTRNPWDLTRTPGGSSGGTAAAVAAGIVPAAGASDGGGSIRIPAACCGLFGLKASRGLTPAGPFEGEHLFGMAVDGVISRSVRDTAGLLQAILGPEPTAEYVQVPAPSLTTDLDRPPARLRIGYSVQSFIARTPDPEAVAAVTNAAALLESLGHQVEEVAPPYDDNALARDFLAIWFAKAAGQVASVKAQLGARNSDFEPDTLAVAELGRAGGVAKLLAALENRHTYVRAMTEYHQQYDYLLTPTLSRPPIEIGSLATPALLQTGARVAAFARAGRIMQAVSPIDTLVEQNLGWVPYTQLANLTGQPAMTVPLHWTASGLPLGVQFVGRLGSEHDMLRLATSLEQAQPWADRRPVL